MGKENEQTERRETHAIFLLADSPHGPGHRDLRCAKFKRPGRGHEIPLMEI
jgi:hypothetical protein